MNQDVQRMWDWYQPALWKDGKGRQDGREADDEEGRQDWREANEEEEGRSDVRDKQANNQY